MDDSMKQLVDSLAKQLGAGLPENALRTMIMAQGWSEGDFYSALAQAKKILASQPSAPAPASISMPTGGAMPVRPVQAPVPPANPSPAMAPVAASPAPMNSVPASFVMPRSAPPQPAAAPVQVPVQAPAPAPAPASAPVQAPASFQTMPQSAPMQTAPSGRKSYVVLLIIAILILLGLIGGGAYAYTQKIGPFAQAPYSQSNLISGVLATSAGIRSASYAATTSFFVEPRDEGAQPFDIQIADEQALKEKYARDYERSQDAMAVLGALLYKAKPTDPYPASLAQLKGFGGAPMATSSLVDPLTNAQYQYSVSPDKKDFNFIVTFETADAIAAIDRFASLSGTTTASTTPKSTDPQTVIFTKSSSPYIYVSNRPPKSFLESLRDLVAAVPAEINVKAGVSAASGWDPSASSTDWTLNIDASGDLGDLTYKLNADFLRKDGTYYARINNIPSLFAGYYLPPKGQWVSFDSKSSALSGYLPGDVSKAEESYSGQKAQFVALIKKVAFMADEQKLLAIGSAPVKEKVGDRSLYRYDLTLNKDAILPFYQKLVAEAAADRQSVIGFLANDQGTLNYLQSPAFSQLADYLGKNLTITLWTDNAGNPAVTELALRVVPPATAQQLAGKQAKLVFRLELKDINKPVAVSVPEGSKPLDEVMTSAMDSLSGARLKGQSASVKANLSMIRPQAEIAYDANNSYGKKAFALGPCQPLADTLFADKDIAAAIGSAASSSSEVLCISSADASGKVTSYAVSAALPDDPSYSYCIDSAGAAKEALGKLQGASCDAVR